MVEESLDILSAVALDAIVEFSVLDSGSKVDDDFVVNHVEEGVVSCELTEENDTDGVLGSIE